VQRLPLADSISALVQRQTQEPEEAIQTKPSPQRSANGNMDAGSNLENKLTSSKGGGSPMPDEVRSFMEPRFGADFGGVRVHTDTTAVEMNKELGAQAFTHGGDIYYGAGKSPGKDALTAHELTHTVQQGAVGKAKPKQKSTGKDEGNKDENANENVADENAVRKDKGSNEEKAPTLVGANTATQDARKAVAKVAENGQAKVKDAGEKTATAKEGAAKPKSNPEKTESSKEGAAKPETPEKTGTPKETVAGTQGDVEQKPLAKIDAQEEKIADEQADAQTPIEQASTQLDATVADSKQMANTGVSFAPSPMKPMFATTEEGISALQPEEVLGTAGNGLVLYQTEQPEKSLSATNAGIPVQPIPQDKATKAREQQRLQAEAALSQFMASGQERKAQIAALGTTIQPRIQTAANQSRGAVDAAIAQNQSAIINGIAKARAQAQSQAQSAKSQIIGGHSTAVGAIRASTTAARQRLQTEYQNSLAKLAQIERTMAERIAAPFNKAAQDFRAAGVKVGQEAIPIGAEFQGQYAKESPPEPSNFVTEFLESFDRETYVANWRKAKVEAARDLAASYDEGLRKDANEKAIQLAQNQPPVVQGMQELVATTRSSLQVKYTAALEQLNQSEQQVLQTASTALNGQLQGIDRTLNGTLASLQQMQATQLSQLKGVGQQQKLGIDRTAKQATAALQQGVNQANDSLQGAFQQFSEQARSIKAPSLQVIQAVIAEAQGQLNSLIADARTEVETGITNAAQEIVQQSQQTVGSLNTLGQQAASSGAAVVQELSTSIAQAVQSASQTFSQLQIGHTNAVKASADKVTGEFKQMTGDVEQKLDGVIQNLTQKLDESAGQLENGLRGSLGNLRSEIPKKAQEAADKVQPAWKSVVKVLIDIAITVAVTVAIAALAASGVGLVAAIGLAALIGAAGALVKQGANDLIDGKMSSWKTYATQAGFGAVGGVLQMVGLRGAEKAAGWLTNTAGKTAAKFGIEALGETGADISQRLAAGDKFSLAMLGVSFGTSLLGGAGGEALNGAFGKLGAKLGVNKIDNAALKTGGEFVTDTISETATDVTSQVVFEGKDLSWQTVGESAGTSAFGNLVGRGANRAYGDRLRNLGGSNRATSGSPPQLIDPNTNQPVGQTPTPPQLIDPNTNQPVGQTPTPPQLIDPNTNQPIGQTPTPPQLIDPNTNQPIGQTPTPPQLIDPNTNQLIGDTSTPTKSKDEGLTPIPSDQSKDPSKTPKDNNSETETSPEKSPSPQADQTNNGSSARTKIEEIKDFKKLREMVEKGELGDPKTAQQTLQEARNQIIDSVLDGEGGVRAILKQRYPDIEIEFKDLGSKGFGSDRDITVKVTGGKDANENARASVEGVREAYNQLRKLGFEPDKALDSNFYTELHEGNITPTSKAEAAQILQDQSVTSLAEMRMNMSPEQWQAYKQQQLESLGLGKDATGVQDSSQAEARDRLQQQLQDAENLAAGLQDKSKPKEQVLAERQAALLKALEQNASPREIRQLMAEVKLLEPDAYGTRAAVEGVVDYQQAMKGDKGDGYWDIYTGRADKLPDDTSERFTVLSQEASASLAKMYSHSHGETGNSVSDVLAMAKYLGRIDHAHFEAGLSTSNDPVIDTMRQLMATKANGGSQADTVRVLREWAQANNLSDLTDQQIEDAWVAQAQALGQDLVVKLRSSEQMAHVFAPKDVNDSIGSGSDSSTSIQSGDSLPDATATSDKTNSAETRDQTDLETLPNTPEKPKDADESSSSLESTEVQDTTKVQSLNPDLEQTLTTALPNDLQGKVPINVDPDLPGNTVRVHYDVDANGLVTNVHMRVGPNASAVDIQLHAQTVRLMQNYSGFSGRIRILKERIQKWISKNGEPPVGSRAWEAKLEVEKLPRIIDERLERLSKGDLDADAQANLRTDIENLQQQLATHQKTLDEMDTNPGRGFVAADGKEQVNETDLQKNSQPKKDEESQQSQQSLSPNHPGVELHNHFTGILTPAKIIELTGKQPSDILTDLWNKSSGSTKTILREILKNNGILAADTESLNLSNLKVVEVTLIELLTARTIPFDETYRIRGTVLLSIPPEKQVRATLEQLRADGIKYAELQGGLPRGIDQDKFKELLKEYGREVRFLEIISSERLASEQPIKEDHLIAKPERKALEQVGKDGTIGIDIAGAERRFTSEGMKRFKKIYETLKEKAEKQGSTLVLRPHVGEGYPQRDNTGKLDAKSNEHRRIAQENLEHLLKTLEELQTNNQLSDKLIVRLGHATHATPAQLARIQKLGIIVEANLTSNLVTQTVADPVEQNQVLLKFMFHDVKTILNTDAGGVMSTSLQHEYELANTIIARFNNNEIPIVVDNIHYYFNEIPDEGNRESGVEYRILPEEKRKNFDIERLKKEAKDYSEKMQPNPNG